jgi:hypothetical protein
MVAQNRNKLLNVWRKTIMSSTHLSLYYHLVFSTHDRLRWIDKSWQERLAQYKGTNENIIEKGHFRKNISSCSMKMELNLMRSIYGKASAAPRGACLAGILRSRGCAPRCGASPRAIAPSAPPAPDINVETPDFALKGRNSTARGEGARGACDENPGLGIRFP